MMLMDCCVESRPHPSLLDETTSHSTKLPKTAAKSLVTPQAEEGVEVPARSAGFAPSLARSAGEGWDGGSS